MTIGVIKHPHPRLRRTTLTRLRQTAERSSSAPAWPLSESVITDATLVKMLDTAHGCLLVRRALPPLEHSSPPVDAEGPST